MASLRSRRGRENKVTDVVQGGTARGQDSKRVEGRGGLPTSARAISAFY